MKKYLIVVAMFFLTSCAVFRTSVTPEEVAGILPIMTDARFMTVAQAEDAVQAGTARYLTRREYVVPVGLTVKNELERGAKGIDEWVKLDGGNAYVLVNYKWITVDNEGSTQLHLEFDTRLCK
jgi:hypothetical protein